MPTPVVAPPVAPVAPPTAPKAPEAPKTPDNGLPLSPRQKIAERLKAINEKQAAEQAAKLPKEPQTPDTQETERRAQAIARVKKEEARVLKEKAALTTEREKLTAAQAEHNKRLSVLDQLQASWGQDPTSFAKNIDLAGWAKLHGPQKLLELAGIKIDDLLDLVASDKFDKPEIRPPDEIARQAAREEWDKLQKQRDELDRRAAQANEQERLTNAQKKQIDEITQHLELNPEKYVFLLEEKGAAVGSAEIWEYIADHYAETVDPKTGKGERLKFEDVADQAEAALKDNFLQRSKKHQEALAKEALEQETAKAGSTKNTAVPTLNNPNPETLVSRKQSYTERLAALKQRARQLSDS